MIMEKIAKNHKTFFYEILHMKRKLVSFVISAVILVVLLPDTFAFSEGIKWYSYDEGMVVGYSEGKKIYINFHAEWCAPCKYMEKTTFSNPTVIAYLNKYGVRAIPDNWFLFKNGDAIGRRKGYIKPDQFMKILKTVQENMGEKKKD